MVVLSQIFYPRLSYVLIGLLVVTLIFTCCFVVYESRNINSDMREAMAVAYNELILQDDFSYLYYQEENLLIQWKHTDVDVVVKADDFPRTTALFSGHRIQYIYKLADDIYFITKGWLDNIKGYVLSEDFSVNMSEIVTLERILDPCQYKLFSFSSER